MTDGRRKAGCSWVAAIIVLWDLAGSPVGAEDAAPPSVSLTCAGRLEAGNPIVAIGPDIAFKTAIPFGQGHFVTLSSPDSNRIEQLLYGSEVQAGSIDIGTAAIDTIVWTRATSRTGGVVGFFIEGSGDITSLSIHVAPKGETDRPFDLFATASRGLYRGSCH